jgi:hypothetical protein
MFVKLPIVVGLVNLVSVLYVNAWLMTLAINRLLVDHTCEVVKVANWRSFVAWHRKFDASTSLERRISSALPLTVRLGVGLEKFELSLTLKVALPLIRMNSSESLVSSMTLGEDIEFHVLENI